MIVFVYLDYDCIRTSTVVAEVSPGSWNTNDFVCYFVEAAPAAMWQSGGSVIHDLESKTDLSLYAHSQLV